MRRTLPKRQRVSQSWLSVINNTYSAHPVRLKTGGRRRYKSLTDIERGFRVLKSEIEIGPVYHRLHQRIKAHAAICFMALILYRVMRARLRVGDAKLSPERALEKLRRIQHQKIILNKTQPVTGLSTITQEHQAILATLLDLMLIARVKPYAPTKAWWPGVRLQKP